MSGGSCIICFKRTIRFVNMRALAKKAFGGFHDGFREGGMRMDGKF